MLCGGPAEIRRPSKRRFTQYTGQHTSPLDSITTYSSLGIAGACKLFIMVFLYKQYDLYEQEDPLAYHTVMTLTSSALKDNDGIAEMLSENG